MYRFLNLEFVPVQTLDSFISFLFLPPAIHSIKSPNGWKLNFTVVSCQTKTNIQNAHQLIAPSFNIHAYLWHSTFIPRKLQTLVCGLLVEYAIIVVMRQRACTQVLRIYFSRYIQKQRSIGLYGTDSLQTQKVFLHSLKNIYEKTITYQLQIQDKRTSLPQLVMAPNRQITRVCSSLDIGIFSGSERCLLFLFTCRWDKKMDFSPLHGVQFGIIANSTSIPAPEKINEFNIFSIQTSYCTITREHWRCK